MNKIVSTLFFIVMFFSCNEKKQIGIQENASPVINTSDTVAMVEKIVINYEKDDSVMYDMITINPQDIVDYYANYDETADDVMYIDFDDKYSDYAIRTYSESLKKMGYEKPGLDVIQLRSKDFFGYNIECDSNDILYKVCLARYIDDSNAHEERIAQKKFMNMVNDTLLGGFWRSFIYVREGGFLVKKPTINGIVAVENCEVDPINGKYMKIGNKVSFIWNAPQIKETYHLSNYVFFNNIGSFRWLLSNKSEFLKDLCLVYHYDSNSEINKLVIDDVLEKIGNGDNVDLIRAAYKDVFVGHDGNGKLYIHKGLLSYLVDYKIESSWLVDNLRNVFKDDVYGSFDGSSELLVEYTEEERMKIAAYVIYYFDRYNEYANSDMFVKTMMDNNVFLEFLSDNEYFGLEGFSFLVEKLRQY